MKNIFSQAFCFGAFLLLSFSTLSAQTINLDSVQQIQLMKNEFCAVIEVNASWNWKNKVPIENLEKCYTGYVDLSNKDIGAIIQNEWNIQVVPTIIIFQYGKEIKRYEADLSMKFHKDEILNKLRNDIINVR